MPYRCSITCAAGLTIPCLYNASEALRLSSSIFLLMSSGTAATTDNPAQTSALPSYSGTPPDDGPAKTLTDPTPSLPPHIQPDARMKNADISDSSTEAAGVGTAAPAQAAEARTRVGADQGGVEGVGYWQVAWLYLTSLLKLGEAYEVAGSHEDAVHAFREGLQLVCA